MSQTNNVKSAFGKAWDRGRAAEKIGNFEHAITIYSEMLDTQTLTKLQRRGTKFRRKALESRLLARKEIPLLDTLFALPSPPEPTAPV